MVVPIAEVPALTIVAGPAAAVSIRGSDARSWSLRLCAVAGAPTRAEAEDALQYIRMNRLGGMVSVAGKERAEQQPALGWVSVEAPAEAPVVVNGSYAAVEVSELSGPVRVATTHARVTLERTTGNVDAAGAVVDFTGNRGQVRLSGMFEVNVGMTANRFEGSLEAASQRPVRLALPRGFESSIRVIVGRKKDFVCRADICSQFKHERSYGLHVFTYAGESSQISDGGSAPEQDSAASPRPALLLRSENSAVVIDNTDKLTIR
ncbi:MAG: hypothetical protein K6U02_04810 [Firmicutes bacterium]|nr:hypothetical protein [Bacillota bacterium]